MVQYSMKMHQIVTTRLNNLQYHSLLRLNSNELQSLICLLLFEDSCEPI